MDSEEIARRVLSLKISSYDSGETISIPSDLAAYGKHRLDFCLVCKVFSSKAVNRETFHVHMPRMLQSKKSMQIEVIGENTFLLDFASEIDRRHALLDGPWHFFKDMAIFKAPEGLQKTSDLVFDEIPMWVQCHNVPLAFMHSAIIRNLGSRIGRVLEVDEGEEGKCSGRHARIRVSLNINHPLKQCLWVKSHMGSDDICIIIVYEKLPNFCFNCGKLGHVQRDCDIQEENAPTLKFGNWLKASSVSGDKKVNTSKANTNYSSGSPTGDSQEEGSEDIIIRSGSVVKHVGTDSSRDKSVTDYNLVSETIVLQSDNLLHELHPENRVMELCTDKKISMSPEVDTHTSTEPHRKQWKRLARDKSKFSTDNTESSPHKDKGKRAMHTQADSEEGSKRARKSTISGTTKLQIRSHHQIQ
ncbi:uncharacterized protein [Primulina huaijiensis]|uniref:uncharacterized protein n=1 Tax=Primulina huaijiensis TaxID=1492673 RepID=UPI003CC74236